MMSRVANFAITIAPNPKKVMVVRYATRNGTAQAGVEYTAKSGSLIFTKGQTSKLVSVPIADSAGDGKTFYLDVSWDDPDNNTVSRPSGICVIGAEAQQGVYYNRFVEIYTLIKDTSTGYFGPPTGTKAFQYPYHAIEKLMVEAPDSGHQSVSETASFWAKLEAWNIAVTGSKTGYETMWNRVEANFIPAGANQTWGDFNAASPATYQPEQETPDLYPVLPVEEFPEGAGTSGGDPLYAGLLAAYGNKNMYLMHWMIDVDGDYGFHNADGAEKGVFINSYQRGMQESTWETITHPEFEIFDNGGNEYGFLPLYGQSKPTYPEAPFDYARQVRYTCAPDAEGRMIQAGYLAKKFAAAKSLAVTTQDAKAKKMGDYLRYALYDKYFHKGAGVDGSGFTGLISWYVSYGIDYPTSGTPTWGFRISSSNYHQGYQAPDIAYFMATNGGGYTPSASGAGSMWESSLLRQLEFIRWLQTPEGPIAGGVTNSWLGRYETPDDGREDARFYGMYYTYAPEWHDPPSNNWFGFQVWGLERLATLYAEVATGSGSLRTETRTKCGVILDRWVNWLLDNSSLDAETNGITLPITLHWHSATEVVGETTTEANLEGVFEYLPTLNWPGDSPDYAAFWSASSVPNPKLKCIIDGDGLDIGSAAGAAQLLLHYVHAKRLMGDTGMTGIIPGGAHTVREVFDLAKGILDILYDGYKDSKGFTKEEARADYSRFEDEVFVPEGYSGQMPNGDVIEPGVTFIDIRTFMKDWEGWDSVQAYLDGGDPPVFTYHRFWHTVDVAVGYAMLHYYFSDVVYDS